MLAPVFSLVPADPAPKKRSTGLAGAHLPSPSFLHLWLFVGSSAGSSLDLGLVNPVFLVPLRLLLCMARRLEARCRCRWNRSASSMTRGRASQPLPAWHEARGTLIFSALDQIRQPQPISIEGLSIPVSRRRRDLLAHSSTIYRPLPAPPLPPISLALEASLSVVCLAVSTMGHRCAWSLPRLHAGRDSFYIQSTFFLPNIIMSVLRQW